MELSNGKNSKDGNDDEDDHYDIDDRKGPVMNKQKQGEGADAGGEDDDDQPWERPNERALRA